MQLFRESNARPELDAILLKAGYLGLKEEEKQAILKAWLISMASLPNEARMVIRLMSMLSHGQIPEELMNRIVNEEGEEERTQRTRFERAAFAELVQNGSLLQCYSRETGYCLEMH